VSIFSVISRVSGSTFLIALRDIFFMSGLSSGVGVPSFHSSSQGVKIGLTSFFNSEADSCTAVSPTAIFQALTASSSIIFFSFLSLDIALRFKGAFFVVSDIIYLVSNRTYTNYKILF